VEHRRVPQYEYTTVEVPQYILKIVGVPREYEQIVEEVVHVPRRVEQARPKEVIVHVRKQVLVPREKIVEVPKAVQVPKPYVVENPVPCTTFRDVPWPVVVAQKLIPVLVNECVEEAEVEVKNYVPYIVPIDVYVPRAVELPYILGQSQIQQHVVTGVPVAHWNGLVYRLNQQMIDDATLHAYAPVLRDTDGSSPVAANPPLVQPIVSVSEIVGYPNFLEYLRRLEVQGPIQGLGNVGVPVHPSYQPGVPVHPNYQPGVPVQPIYQPGVPVQTSYQPGVPVQPSYQPGVPLQPSYPQGVTRQF